MILSSGLASPADIMLHCVEVQTVKQVIYLHPYLSGDFLAGDARAGNIDIADGDAGAGHVVLDVADMINPVCQRFHLPDARTRHC